MATGGDFSGEARPMAEKSPRRIRLEQSLAEDPGDAFLRYGVAMQCLREGDVDEGRRRLMELIADRPDDQVAAHQQLGQSYMESGEAEQARRLVRRGDRPGPRPGAMRARGGRRWAIPRRQVVAERTPARGAADVCRSRPSPSRTGSSSGTDSSRPELAAELARLGASEAPGRRPTGLVTSGLVARVVGPLGGRPRLRRRPSRTRPRPGTSSPGSPCAIATRTCDGLQSAWAAAPRSTRPRLILASSRPTPANSSTTTSRPAGS